MKLKFNPFTSKFDFVSSKATEIGITDAGSYFSGATVELALQELGLFTFTTLPSTYLKLSADNDPVTGQLDVNNVLTATDFQGYGGVPITASKGLKSPYTNTVVVDAGGKGDFTSVKAACDYVATQSPTSTTPWIIKVEAGIYEEDALTVPTYTTIIGKYQHTHNQFTYDTNLTFAQTSGNYVTLSTMSGVRGLRIEQGTNGYTPTGDVNAIYAGASTTTNISNCIIRNTGRAGTYYVRAVYKQGNGTMFLYRCEMTCGNTTFTYAEVLNHNGSSSMGISYCTLVPTSAGNGKGLVFSGTAPTPFIAYTRIGDASGTGFATDIEKTSTGTVYVNNTPYKNSTGSIVHLDRFYPTEAAIREAPAATDTPLILKGATSQTANLTEWQNSAAGVLAAIGPAGTLGIGIAPSAYNGANVIVTDSSTNTISGFAFTARKSAGGTTGNVNGANGSVQVIASGSGAATATIISGGIFGVTLTGSGANTATASLAAGVRVSEPSLTAPISVTASRMYGIEILNQGNALLTSSYGLYIEPQSGATTLNYAIYTNAGIIHAGDKIEFTQTDGNEAIDSANDGYLDYYATTLHRFNQSIDITGNCEADTYSVGGVAGIDKSITVLDADGTTTHALVFTKGVLTACTTT